MGSDSAYHRLNQCAFLLNMEDWRKHGKPQGYYNGKRFIQPGWSPLEAITETCDILGSGDEEQIKLKLDWFRIYYPKLWKKAGEEMKNENPKTGKV